MAALKRYLPDIWIAILLLLLPLLLFFPQTLGGRTLIPAENLFQYAPYQADAAALDAPTVPQNHLLSDLVLQNYQWKSFIRAQIAQGEVPLWNPHQLGGIPFLAAGQHSALYPLSVIYYTLPLWLAYGWFTVINLWLAGLFMYAFARGIGIGRAGSLLAGVVYQLGGFVIASVVFQMMIGGLPWLPLMLLASELILRRAALFGRRTALPWTVLGAGALGMNVLAGHIEITLYSLLITGFYAGIRWLHDWMRRGDTRHTLVSAGWLLAMVLLGIGLSAIQFIPMFDFVQTNWRAERGSYETVVGYAHPVRDVLQFALPNFYGNPSHQRIFDVFNFEWVGAWANDAGQPHTEWGVKNYVESALYVGILPLLLALYALLDRLLRTREVFQGSRRLREVFISEAPYRLIFSLLGLLSLTFMFGLPTYRLIYALPGFNQLNSPFRWIFALTVAVAVLAAFGLDALERRAAEKQSRMETRIGLGLFALGGLVLLGLIASYFAFPQLAPTIESALDALTFARRAFGEGTAALFYSYQFANVAVFALMLLLSGWIFYWVGRMRMYRRVKQWALVAVLIVAADLMIASWGFNPASNPRLLDYTPPVVGWMQQQYESEGAFRFTTVEPPNTRPILNANSTLQYGLDDIRGYDSIIPADYVDAMRDLAPQVQLDFNRIAPIFTQPAYYDSHPADNYFAVLDDPLLDQLNLRYVVTYPDVAMPDDWVQVYADETLVVYENPDALPRIYLRVDDDVLPVTDYVSTGRETTATVTLTEPATLFVSENYAPGWKAFIRLEGAGEGEERELAVVEDGLVQRVDIEAAVLEELNSPSDRYTLRLVYSPQSVQVGFFGSAVSAIVLTMLVGMWLWMVFVGVNDEHSSQTAKVVRNSVAPVLLNLFNRTVDFVFAIVLYRLLSQEMVGIYNFAVVVFVWFDIFTNFGLDLFMMREVSRDKSRSGYYLFNTSFIRLGLSVVGFGLLALFLVTWQATADPLPVEGLLAMVLLYVGLFPASLSKGMTSLYYAHEQAEKPAAIATITSINKAVFGVIVLLLGWGIVGLALVSIVNNILTLVVLVWTGRALIGALPRKPDRPLLGEMVRESYPLLLNHFLATIFFQIDIVILQALRGAALQAQYSTAYKWLLAINILPAFFTQALFPMMSRQAASDRTMFRRTYQFGIKLLLSVALPVAVGFTVLAEILTVILAGAPYLPVGAIALTIMIWSIPFGWMNSLTQYALIALNLQRHITWAFFLAVTFNIVTNLIFIPIYGYQAAAVTTILSEAVLLLPFGVLMHRGLGQPVAWFSLIWRPVLATGAMIVVVWLLLPLNMIAALIVASVVYLGVLLALNPLDEHERAILQPMLPQRFRSLPFLRVDPTSA